MIQLDYRTNNPRWGLSGVIFNNWNSYARTIGFLCNIEHYIKNNINRTIFSRSIEIHREANHTDGAWDEELRIHYYGDIDLLRKNLPDLADCSSAGFSNITCRINSNLFMKSLVDDYKFETDYNGYINDIFPPSNIYSIALKVIYNRLQTNAYDNDFEIGWNL